MQFSQLHSILPSSEFIYYILYPPNIEHLAKNCRHSLWTLPSTGARARNERRNLRRLLEIQPLPAKLPEKGDPEEASIGRVSSFPLEGLKGQRLRSNIEGGGGE